MLGGGAEGVSRAGAGIGFRSSVRFFFSGVLHPSIRRDPLMNKPVLAVRI